MEAARPLMLAAAIAAAVTLAPAASRSDSAPVNASPAPVVSTASTGGLGTSVTPDRSATTARPRRA